MRTLDSSRDVVKKSPIQMVHMRTKQRNVKVVLRMTSNLEHIGSQYQKPGTPHELVAYYFI